MAREEGALGKRRWKDVLGRYCHLSPSNAVAVWSPGVPPPWHLDKNTLGAYKSPISPYVVPCLLLATGAC